MANLVIRARDDRGDNRADREAIETAFDRALSAAQRIEGDIESVWNQSGRVWGRRQRRRDAWNANPNFATWLGRDPSQAQIRRTRRRMRRLCRWLNRARIVVVVHGDGHRFCERNGFDAYVIRPRRPLRMHLCAGFFDHGLAVRASIAVHELVHCMGFWHPRATSNEAEARQLARDSPGRAQRSPENYEHLYRAYSR